jgi:hypothetical protein
MSVIVLRRLCVFSNLIQFPVFSGFSEGGGGWYLLSPPVHRQYTGCPKRNVPDFGRVFLMLKYTDITQNTYIQS